jgi:hypothetical protein
MLKNTASRMYIFVVDRVTNPGKGVTGLTAAGSFTSIKLDQDGTLSSDIKSTLTNWLDEGTGGYSFDVTAAQTNYGTIKPIAVPSSADYQAYGTPVYTHVLLTTILEGTTTLSTAFQRVLAYCAGKITRSTLAYTYRNQADDADVMTLTSSSTTRTRT